MVDRFYIKTTSILAFILAGTLLFSQSTFALSAPQRQLYNLGVNQFDIATESNTCSADASSITLTGNSRAAKAFNFFVEQGLTDAQAAGVVGNLEAESNIMPNRRQGDGIQTINSVKDIVPDVGFGIAQWTVVERQINWKQFAIEKKMDPLSLGLQLLFLWHELESDPEYYGLEHLTSAKDLTQATWIFLAFFERPGAVVDAGKAGDPVQPTSGSAKATLDERVALAQKVTGGDSKTSDTSTEDLMTSCDEGGSGSTGGVFSADGYTFPIKTNRSTIINDKPTPWCYGKTENCHHDYNASDIFAPVGTLIVATRGGKVVNAKDNAVHPSSIGSRVTIMGDDGWLYYYAHMGSRTLKVKDGQTVKAGDVIGAIGTSENAAGTDPHLHIDRLPGKKYSYRPSCSGASCNGYPFDNIQGVMSEVFKAVK